MKNWMTRRTWLLAALAIAAGTSFAALGPTSTAVASGSSGMTFVVSLAELRSSDGGVDISITTWCEAKGDIELELKLTQAIDNGTAMGSGKHTIKCAGASLIPESFTVPIQLDSCSKPFQLGDAYLTIDGNGQDITIE